MSDGEPEKFRQFPVNAIQVARTAQQIHVQLSQMADQKANMLLAATFLVFTISVGQVHGSSAPLPLLVLAATAFFSAVCAILAVMPATGPIPGKINLLFFGSFTSLAEDDYVERLIGELLHDETACRLMAHDIYQNGLVLQRKKYRLLGYAYRIFLVGLTMSFLLFVVQYGFWTL